jgi:hypothetical protein
MESFQHGLLRTLVDALAPGLWLALYFSDAEERR